jgi:hypothetical protein
MHKFYYKRRNIGLNPDETKYYFSTVDELFNTVKFLNGISNNLNFIRWSISSSSLNKYQYTLMSEYWTTNSIGTDIPLKCKRWFVYGYIYDNETDMNIYDLFPKFEADYTNHFIENRYMTPTDFINMTEDEKYQCTTDGGIILNKNLT